MKIGLCIRTYNPCSGGLQAHAAQLCQELLARGHEVRVVTRSISKTPSYADYFLYTDPVARIAVGGSQVTVLRRPAWWRPLLWVSMKCRWRPRLARLGVAFYRRAFEPGMRAALQGVDLIHHVGQGAEMIGFAAAGAARALRIPFIAQPTVHPGQWGDSEFDFMLYRQADRLLVHTLYEADWFSQRLSRAMTAVVGNGIQDQSGGNAARFRKRHALQDPFVLFIGRKTADKGHPLCREAYHIVRQQRPEVALVCMGPGVAKQPPEPGVLELGFADESEKHDALAACSLLCVPSEGESFGLVYMEAGRYGKPVIGRRLPVLEELLGSEEAGLLVGTAVGAGNQVAVEPEELANAILRVITQPELARRLGDSARRVSGRFVWSEVATRFEAAYRETLTSVRR